MTESQIDPETLRAVIARELTGARQLPCGDLRCEWGASRNFVNAGRSGRVTGRAW